MIFILLLAMVDAYLSLLLLRPLTEAYPVLWAIALTGLQLAILALAWLFFIFFRSTADKHIPFEKPLRIFAFYGMGAISFLFVFSLFRDFLALLLLPFGQAFAVYGPNTSLLILLLSGICFVVGAMNAQMRILTPQVKIRIPGLPAKLEGLKLVQMSDIHLGTGPNAKQVGKLVDRALSLQPDLIVLTGDIIDGNIPDITEELKEMSRLKAPHGVYFVLGNHECYWKHEDAIAAMKVIGITVLQNEGVVRTPRGETIFIAGLNDPAITHTNGEGPRIPAVPPESKLNLILVHQPQIAPKIAEHPYHLQLSGHTHGGQFFPWNLVVKKMYQFNQGLGKLKNLWVYVNMGSGYWGPPVRLGSQCEVTELVFIPA